MTGKTPNFEVPKEMRDMAETSLNQAKSAVDEFLGAAGTALGKFEDGTSSAQTGLTSMNRTALSFMEENIANAFSFAERLVKARDATEVMKLQADYLKAQMSVLGEQTRVLTDAAQKAASEAADKFKG